MKRKIRISSLLMIVLCLAMALCGCGKTTLAAKVGEVEITTRQLENAYANYSSYASYYGYSLTTEEGVESYQDYLLDQMIREEIAVYQAKQAGITLTDEEKADAKKKGQENYDSFYQDYLDAAKNAGASDVKAYANSLLSKSLAENNSTVSKVKQSYIESAENSTLTSKHKEQLLAAYEITDEDIKARYEEDLAAQQSLFDATPASYFTYETYYTYGYTAMPLYIPAGLFRVRQILVADEATADAVLEKINAGEDFETLLKEYNTDPGMTNETYAAGYLVGEGANFAEEFLNAALALEKDGDVSAVVKSEFGYHIIKRVSTEEAHVIPYEEVETNYVAYATNLLQTEYYNSLVDTWMADESVVARYPENYRSIGKAALAQITASPEATAEQTAEPADGNADSAENAG